ncbi:MAG: hypothetical protein IV101_19485 [Dechloromonas sp.]|uniref:hypothetical protein n=1 Tax=Dechloromonas sp. TaxID=1917218 RepID=UPI0027E92352|nr:hypothetical protein [Dechloromonas sp.]MBT9523064.1 hypothetical protein [Dechloromonas sp.]
MKSQPAGRQSHDLNRELANACFEQAAPGKSAGLFVLLPGKHPAPQVAASAASSQFDFCGNRHRHEKTRRLKTAGFRGRRDKNGRCQAAAMANPRLLRSTGNFGQI